MKKRLTAIIITVFAAIIFFAGWVQFAVPAGKYGILISKTGGVNQHPIIPAQFRWQWERLLPTNTTILIFDLAPKSVFVSTSGILPSGELYSRMLEGNPDFSWKIDINLSGRVQPERLPSLVRDHAIRKQDDLDKWTDTKLKSIATSAGTFLASDFLKDPAAAANMAAQPGRATDILLKRILSDASSGIEIVECSPSAIHTPDLDLYHVAAKTYNEYQKSRNDLLSKTAAAEANAAVSEYLQIERFGRWGELLTKYPILIDFLAVAKDDAGQAFKAVRSLK